MKGYRQYCPVAHALDQVGDRWELLIVRELMLGQRRYTDLAEALPGIGSNVLAQRLRELEAAGIVRKTKLPPPFAVSVYELTDYGRELDDVLRSLARFGARTLGAPAPEDCWSMYAVHARFRPEAAVDGTYEIRFVDGETISLQVKDGELVAMKLPAESPTLVVEAPPEELHAIVGGVVSVKAALAEGRVRLPVGTEKELRDLVAMFAPAESAAEPSASQGAVAA
ncbi:MAG TPA: helix-turn-helix domain-containing protein [Gaiella sp.]|nr:helix-turn-helix domain-containing protein [Gaiella sp.]